MSEQSSRRWLSNLLVFWTSRRIERRDGARRTSTEPKVLLTFERGGIIVAKQFGYVDGGIMGVAAVCEDGSSRLFAVKSDPTNAEFYKIKIVANASQDDQRKAVEDATRAGVRAVVGSSV